ncbi:MAG TPA: hemerythrin domain-containing protein [Ilumatobacter sp.]|jgi:hemerythrin superfamily protein|nr:hemerythrin domain-containing protein [Ilumatobacter sp.]
MDAIALLRDDHKTVEQLFKRFEKAGDRAYVEKRQIVDRIIEELSVHAAIEEQVFYPVARETVPGTEDVALESLEEHHIVKWLLSELVDLDPEHERFDAKVTVLMENVRHHVEEEQDEFFPKVRAQLSRTALADLGQALADAKKTAPTRPHPRLPDAPPGNSVVGALAGVVDRVGGNVSGVAQGSVTAVQDLIARITGSSKPKTSPTGSTATRSRAKQVRRSASSATDAVEASGRGAKATATKTVKTAASGAKATATTAKKSARATKTTAKRAATTTARTAKSQTKKTVANTKRAAAGTAARKSAA